MIPVRDGQPSGVVPYITIVLIVLNVAAFLYTLSYSDSRLVFLDGCEWETTFGQSAPGFDPVMYRRYGRGCLYPVTERDQFVIRFGLIPAELWSGTDLAPTVPFPIWVTILTSMFLHGGWLHLLGNMLYLWIFGDNVEAALGRGRFLLFYLLTGVGGAVLQAGVSAHSTIPMIGASGAIAGVLGAYLVLFPWARVLTVVPLFIFLHFMEIPALLLLGFWFLLQLFSGLADLGGAEGVAWFAHIGGFIAGALLVFPFKRREVVPGLVTWWRWQRHRQSWR
ncbi:MAG TPA: rhomboid family intramembrane serine protease [Candidatus Bipolaricaulis sp.]|nr:rhomboid family intramembrane serine protease [Candidatus Bipolaricaulis sp.]HRS14189.1 rhomboid family intramembrane serine protease [Candidatus Bipolaricaulis sp.]HRU21738.1 rhomboid family intramembrane serine protease [Candidatus Bipolaricaulis sp.]